MGRKRQTAPTVRHGEEYFYRPLVEGGNFSLVPLGRGRYANEISYGYLESGWRKALEPYAPTCPTDENWTDLERILERYIFNRASELGAHPWVDAIGALERIAKGAADLLAASNGGNASGFIWQRIEAISDEPFKRDDFYPLLSALNRRVHLLRDAMNAERERGDQLSVSAFRHFALAIANFYNAMGGTVYVSKISSGNKDSARASKFSRFAWEAMKQIPPRLRHHSSNPDGWAFFYELSNALSRSDIRGVRKKPQLISPRRSGNPPR